MNKIGRNDPCPCGSGLKYKKCCLPLAGNEEILAVPSEEEGIIKRELAKLKRQAVKKKKSFKLLGAFIFFSTIEGDGWMLELTGKDALLVAEEGTEREITIEETDETLEINWTHSFAIDGQEFVTTSYKDNTVRRHKKCPAQIIRDTLQQIPSSYQPGS
jgi:hypothetical protein